MLSRPTHIEAAPGAINLPQLCVELIERHALGQATKSFFRLLRWHHQGHTLRTVALPLQAPCPTVKLCCRVPSPLAPLFRLLTSTAAPSLHCAHTLAQRKHALVLFRTGVGAEEIPPSIQQLVAHQHHTRGLCEVVRTRLAWTRQACSCRQGARGSAHVSKRAVSHLAQP